MQNLSIALSAALMTSAIAAQTPLAPPPGLQPGDSYRVLVVTDGSIVASSTDIADYNTFVGNDVLNAPELAALDVQWRAVASTDTVSALDNTGTHYSAPGPQGVPVFLRDGTRLADDYDDLWDGTLLAAPDVTASGAVVTGPVWTGTAADGTVDFPVGTNNVNSGFCTASDSTWVDSFPSFPAGGRRLYALSEVLTVPSHPIGLQPGDSYRVLIVTDGTYGATSTDIADYNGFVTQDVATAPQFAGLEWHAVVSTPGVNVRANTATEGSAGLPIFRPDFVRLADDYADFWDGSLLDSPNVTANLAVVTGPVWTGSAADGTTSFPLGTTSVTFGQCLSTDGTWIDTFPSAPAGPRRLYALSEVRTVPLAALEVPRVGSLPNPNAFLPGVTSGPAIGSTWDPVIDHASFAPAALGDLLLLTANPLDAPIPGIASGHLLCDVTNGYALLVNAQVGTPFAIALPNHVGLLGSTFCTQGFSWSPGPVGISFANALDITIGSL